MDDSVYFDVPPLQPPEAYGMKFSATTAEKDEQELSDIPTTPLSQHRFLF